MEIIIKDDKTGLLFGYMEKLPGVCAQGKTADQVRGKIRKYFKAYLKFIDHGSK